MLEIELREKLNERFRARSFCLVGELPNDGALLSVRGQRLAIPDSGPVLLKELHDVRRGLAEDQPKEPAGLT